MADATPLPFDIPAVGTTKLAVVFDCGDQSSDGGVQRRAAERKTGVVARLAAAPPDRRDPTRIQHTQAEIIGARVLAIRIGRGARCPRGAVQRGRSAPNASHSELPPAADPGRTAPRARQPAPQADASHA